MNSVEADSVIFYNAIKSYGKIHVLRKFNMTVEEGKIYALLGASGCGKTTVLSCIVGDKHLDSGHIRIFGLKPNAADCGVPGPMVGYMPQEKGLSLPINVKEIIYYFGRIYGMSESDIEKKLTFLIKLLQLPPKSRNIYSLSGGQQKRLSFAIALLHEPRLLILDEPTVGVDPILRQMLWKYLRQITIENKTAVILSTHYIEEARQADTVGMMRNGRLLAQDEPGTLMRQYGATKLEDVFLTLCVNDDNITSLKSLTDLEKKAERGVNIVSKVHPNSQLKTGSSMNNIGAMTRKNLTRLWRDYLPTLTSLMIGPVIMVSVCFTVGPNPHDINLAVVNHEWPHDPVCIPYDDCLFLNLSCRYLQGLDKNMINLIPYYDESAAESAAIKGDIAGFITFPSNYSDSVSDRILSGIPVDNSTYLNSVFTLRMDMSNVHIALMVQRHLLLKYTNFAEDLLTTCGMNPLLGVAPLTFGKSIYGTNDVEFTHFFAPGVLANAIFGIFILTTAANFVWEKEDGMVQRIVVAGVRHWEIIMAQLATQLFIIIFASICMTLVPYFLLHFPFYSSSPWLFLLCILHGLSSSMFGIFIGVLCPTLTTTMFCGLTAVFLSHLVSGVAWPLECISFFSLKLFCYMNPNTFVNEALRSMFTRGWTIYNTTVWPGYVSVIVWFIIMVSATLFAMRGFRKKFGE